MIPTRVRNPDVTTLIEIDPDAFVEEAIISDTSDRPVRQINNQQGGRITLNHGWTVKIGVAGLKTDVQIRDIVEGPNSRNPKPSRTTIRTANSGIVDVYSGETKTFPQERLCVTRY